jgi:flagellar protein FlgJ
MIQAQANTANVFNDINGLQGIRTLGKSDQDAALKEVAKQFESMFMGMMLKSMRDASDVFSEDSLFNSPESDFYRQMYDDQMSVSLTSGQGTGLAEVIHRQLMAQYGDGNSTDTNVDQSRIFERRFTGISQAIERVEEELQALPKNSHDLSLPPVPSFTESGDSITASGAGTKGQGFATPAEFVAALYPLAEKVGADLGVDAKAIVAQAALETGWGKYTIQDTEGNPSHNLFGIKANGGWQGETVSVQTHEYRQGVRINENAEFRAYGSLEEGLTDYADFLRNSARYQNAINESVSGETYGHALQQSGYATDPNYGRKVERIYHGDTLNDALKSGLTAENQDG